MRIMLCMYCIEASTGIYESTRFGGVRLPGIHMAVYDMYFYDYQIYSNRTEQPGKHRSFLCMALKQPNIPW
jgi:hypothetical protein